MIQNNHQKQTANKLAVHYRADPMKSLAEWTGLEPATPGVTGRYSNQLNYHSAWDEFDTVFQQYPSSSDLPVSRRDVNPVFQQYLASPRGFEPL
jgi:hypothetical protein